MAHRIVLIHPDAPPKPAWGADCNGCGVCCLAGPCPVGMVLSRKLTGACVALRWDGARYRCGAIQGGALRRRLLARWISAGSGCDSHLQPAGKP